MTDLALVHFLVGVPLALLVLWWFTYGLWGWPSFYRYKQGDPRAAVVGAVWKALDCDRPWRLVYRTSGKANCYGHTPKIIRVEKDGIAFSSRGHTIYCHLNGQEVAGYLPRYLRLRAEKKLSSSIKAHERHEEDKARNRSLRKALTSKDTPDA